MANRNRTAGHNYERDIVKQMKEMGFEDAVTSRAESRNMDAKKVDVFGPSMLHHIQTKVYQSTFNYPKFFLEECLPTDKPVVILHKKVRKSPKGGRFMPRGEFALMKKQTYYEMLKYKMAYDILMDNWDELAEDTQVFVHRKLKELDL